MRDAVGDAEKSIEITLYSFILAINKSLSRNHEQENKLEFQ